jgi:hypothetical protein
MQLPLDKPPSSLWFCLGLWTEDKGKPLHAWYVYPALLMLSPHTHTHTHILTTVVQWERASQRVAGPSRKPAGRPPKKGPAHGHPPGKP